MADKHSSEFKAKVALDAITQGRAVIEKIAQKYDVSEEEVRAWTAKMYNEAESIFGEETEFSPTGHEDSDFIAEDVYLSTDSEKFNYDVEYGVTKDDLNYKQLIFWSSLIVGLVIIMSVGLVYFAEFSLFDTQQRVSGASPASVAQELKTEQMQELNSFGVVDLEEGLYRIPIDSAINRIAID